MTLRLYYKDAYCADFDAKMLRAVSGERGTTGIILDRSCFYPTSGGQPCDHGTLGSVSVVDVSEDDGDIVHWISGKLKGPSVHGRISWPRRFDHMQQHTGQHILSQAFLNTLGGQTIGFHLGEKSSTIDLDRASLEAPQAESVEELANGIVFDNRRVLTRFVGPEELASLELRKAPAVKRNIRIVEIEGFDRTPCGGTHCSKTGEVGPIAIRKWERRGQETRVEFLCGWRAVRDYHWKTAAINELSLAFSVKDEELTAAVFRLIQEAADDRHTVNRLRNELLSAEAATLATEAPLWNDARIVRCAFVGRPPEEVRRLALLLAKGHKTIALLGVSGKQARLFFACTQDLTISMAALLRDTCATFGGGGGGQPHLAQGGGFPGDKLNEALDFAYDALARG